MGPGFDPHRCRVVSLRKTHNNSLQYWLNQERLLYPDMAEKLSTGTLSLNNNISVKMDLLLCMLLFLYIFNGTIIKFNSC